VSKRRLVLIAAGISLLYLLIQGVYIYRLPLVMDEFDGANEAYQLLELTPYKDYRPYKTVLGYYVELPPLLLTGDPWTGMMWSKLWLALINTAAIFTSTMTLATLFSPAAAVLSQVLLISVSTFLERSSELRVDMLTAWAGLASFLLLLNRRWLAAGILAGVSFLISQKGVYYMVAAGAAAGVFWLFESRDWRTFRKLIVLNGASVAVIAIYILLWGMVATPSAVFSATFLSHGTIAFSDFYNLEEHWTRTLTRNPLFYWGAIAGIIALVAAWWRGRAGATHLMAAVYGAVLFALCRWHKQPWPYFFVLLIPTLMVVHAAAADMLWRNPRLRMVAVGVVAVFGVAWPLTFMPGILERDSAYQQHVIRLADAMLGEQDTYLAGNDLIYDRHQAHPLLRRLSSMQLAAMKQWPPERHAEVIADLERIRPKLLIDDTRMGMVSGPLRTYLDSKFARASSSVNLYAPLVAANDTQFEVWFDGDYRIDAPSGEAVIDGVHRAAGSVVALQRGSHRNDGGSSFRLHLQPAALAAFADPAMQRQRLMFSRAYDY
jgi:hypothetical protein